MLRWSCRRRSGCRRSLFGEEPLPLDPLLPPIALVEGVLHLVYLAHQVGDLDQLRRGVAPRNDDVLEAGPVFQYLDDLARIHPAELHGVGELVEQEHVVGLVRETALDLFPAFAGLVRALDEVSGGPGPTVAHLEPVYVAEFQGRLVLADLPLAALDELVDAYPVAARPAPEHEAEGGGGLALAVPRVDHEQRPLAVR